MCWWPEDTEKEEQRGGGTSTSSGGVSTEQKILRNSEVACGSSKANLGSANIRRVIKENIRRVIKEQRVNQQLRVNSDGTDFGERDQSRVAATEQGLEIAC